MLERMKHEKSVDIYGHVTCMRAQRNYMVQTEDQYIFIHEALLEAATCGNTEVPARNLYAHIQKLTQPPPGETVTAMELEFKVIDEVFIFSFHLFTDGAQEVEIINKVTILPVFFLSRQQNLFVLPLLWCNFVTGATDCSCKISVSVTND